VVRVVGESLSQEILSSNKMTGPLSEKVSEGF
jgi:hypothetical protein